uniref:Trissin n=1 Tax=Anopheles albimanus TaxID=7167 RepID=A0A182FZM8_ANOAL
MNSAAYISIILGCCVLWVACSFPVALSCDSCGRECASACGTRHFRTCCFNYLRKRSSTPSIAPPGTDNHLEQWYAAKSAQKPRLNHRRLVDLIMSNVENDIDYEFYPMMTTHLKALREVQPPPPPVVPSSSIGQTSMMNDQESEDTRNAERTVEKSSEEVDSGRLQLLYES